MVMDTDKIAEALSKAGLTMNADGSVTNPNDPSAPLPSSIAMNGAEDGQGRFYTDTEFDKELEAIDKLVGSPAGDEKKPFAEKYEAREQLETLRKNIETKRVLTMVDKDTHDQTLLDNARMQVARIEYRFGKIALDCEEGSVRALDHLVNCAMSQLVGQEFADNVAKMAAVKSDDKIVELVTFPKPQAAIAFPGVLAEQVDLLNTTGAANATRENFPLSIALLNIAFDLLKDHADMTKQLEELHTQTTFFLAQVHGANGDGGNSALYCAKTTLRQISFYLTLQQAGGVDVAKSQLDVVDWVKNVLTLAGYYNQVDLNVQADHCFAAVQAVVKLYLAAEGVDEELAYDLRELKTNVEKKRIEFYMNLMNMASTVLQYKMAGVVMPPVPPGGGEEIEVWYADKLPGIEKKRKSQECSELNTAAYMRAACMSHCEHYIHTVDQNTPPPCSHVFGAHLHGVTLTNPSCSRVRAEHGRVPDAVRQLRVCSRDLRRCQPSHFLRARRVPARGARVLLHRGVTVARESVQVREHVRERREAEAGDAAEARAGRRGHPAERG